MSNYNLMDFEEIDIDVVPFPPSDDYRNLSEDIVCEGSKETAAEVTEAFNKGSFYFAEGVSRTLNDFESRRNNNVIYMGSSGSGKTTSGIEPNLIEPQGSMLISDPKGTLLRKYGEYLKNHGYTVSVMNFQHPEKSLRWNPFMHIKDTQDIVRLSSTLVLDPKKLSKNDPFWDYSNLMYINSLIGYMYETGYKPMNFQSLMTLLLEGERFTRRKETGGVRQTSEKASYLADRFEQLHDENPYSWAYEQFKAVNQASEKTFDCINVTLATKLSNYSSREVAAMTSDNDIDFTKIATERSVVFVLQSDTDRSMDGLVNLFFSQAINRLISFADTQPNQRLPIPVRFFLDDYGATTAIDNLDTIISTIRSRAISVSLILQSEAQLKTSKEGADKTILANCDTYIYMGSNDVDTAKAVCLRCNKPLEQILYMPVGKCWVFERGKKPVYANILPMPNNELIEQKNREHKHNDMEV